MKHPVCVLKHEAYIVENKTYDFQGCKKYAVRFLSETIICTSTFADEPCRPEQAV